MKKIMLMLFMLMLLSSCDSQTYCETLMSTAQKPEVVAIMKKWAKKYVIENNKYSESDYRLGGGMWPGIYRLDRKLDWASIDFSSNSQMRFVGPKAGDLKNGKLDKIHSIYFGEKSRRGILLRMPDSNKFGVSERYLKYVSNDVAVVCREKD